MRKLILLIIVCLIAGLSVGANHVPTSLVKGSFGFAVSQNGQSYTVRRVESGSPADLAGLATGDQVQLRGLLGRVLQSEEVKALRDAEKKIGQGLVLAVGNKNAELPLTASDPRLWQARVSKQTLDCGGCVDIGWGGYCIGQYQCRLDSPDGSTACCWTYAGICPPGGYLRCETIWFF